MAPYDEFMESLEKLRSTVASFRKVVLHSHSPGSFDFKTSTLSNANIDVPSNPEIETEELFIKLLSKVNLDMIAFTDHMKCECSCRISASPLCKDICILPGMEVNVYSVPPFNLFRLHLLVIFPQGFAREQICRILPPGMPDEPKRNGKEYIKDKDIREFTQEVHKHGGIVVAAHVDSNRGIRSVFRQLGREGITLYPSSGQLTPEEEKLISSGFRDWILTAGFDAIEVTNESDKEHYRWISQISGREVSIPVLLSNDAHCIEDMTLANRITHIKMTSVGFDGLKQALKFPDTRIRFPGDVPKTPFPRILGLNIVASDEKGFFEELKIAFSDNLTCLIGPRGSGKSTIIEALRYVFGYNRTLEEIDYPASELAGKVKNLQEATLSNCVIRVAYCRDSNNIDILEAAYDPKEDYTTRVYSKDGEPKDITDVEAAGIYPLRLFGWGELETLGREASRQRELLDRIIPQLREKLAQRELLRSQLTISREEVQSSVSKLTKIMSKNQGEIMKYREYKKDFDNLNTEDAKRLFAALDNAKTKLGVMTKVHDNTRKWVSDLEQVATPDLTRGVDQLFGKLPEVSGWWDKKKDEIRLVSRQSEVQGEIDKGIVILKTLMRELEGYIKGLNEEMQANDRLIREKVSEEAAGQVASELRRTASQRLERVTNLQREYNDEFEVLQGCLTQWKDTAKKLTDLHTDITGRRIQRKAEIEDALNKYSNAAMKISLEFFPDLDRIEFEEHLRNSGILSRQLHGNYKVNHWPETISATCTPIELAEAILTGDSQRLVKSITIHDEKYELNQTIAETLVQTLHPFGEDTDANVKTVDDLKLSRVLTMAEVQWEDLERIMLNDRPVDKVSPGQRSSAMLPLIALADQAPLIIDQPEDNLDNRLVGKMLVDILAALKEQRQIIVATHNPNIVVSGDAEQVIVLEALSASKGKNIQSGSIDVKEIVDSVVDIMEGGKEAFELRQRRYGF